MKKFIPLLLMAIIAFSAVWYKSQEQEIPVTGPEPIKLESFAHGAEVFITPQQLKEQLGSKKLVLLDASLPKIYAKGHIPGAISIGFKGLCQTNGKPGDPLWGTILPPEQLREKLQSLGIKQDSLIVAYSDTFKGPGAGGRAIWQLQKAGFANARLLYGGLPLWKKFGYTLSTDTPKITPSTGLALPTYSKSSSSTVEVIQANLGTTKLVDVRSKGEFDGSDTSHGEARAGHISGAVWLEWTELLNRDGSPKSANTIIAMMAKKGIRPDDDFTLY